MSTTFLLIWALSWGIFAIPIYTYANRIGQNGGFYVLISLIISPLFAFLLLLANGKTEEKQIEEKIKSKEMDDFVKHSTSNQNIQTSNGRYEQLEKIANLKERGVLTEAEFIAEKEKILATSNINTTELQLTAVYRLYKLIKDNKSKIIDSNITIIRTELSEICVDREKSLQLIIDYEKTFHKNLIKSLIELSTNYNSIKETLKPFIEFGIVNAKYPHELIL